MNEHQNPESLDKAAAKHEAIAKELRLQSEKARNPGVPVSPAVETPTLEEAGKIKKPRWDAYAICNDPDKPRADD